MVNRSNPLLCFLSAGYFCCNWQLLSAVWWLCLLVSIHRVWKATLSFFYCLVISTSGICDCSVLLGLYSLDLWLPSPPESWRGLRIESVETSAPLLDVPWTSLLPVGRLFHLSGPQLPLYKMRKVNQMISKALFSFNNLSHWWYYCDITEPCSGIRFTNRWMDPQCLLVCCMKLCVEWTMAKGTILLVCGKGHQSGIVTVLLCWKTSRECH